MRKTKWIIALGIKLVIIHWSHQLLYRYSSRIVIKCTKLGYSRIPKIDLNYVRELIQKKIPRKVRPLAITTCSHPKCSKKNIWLLDSYWSEGWFLYIHSSPKKNIHKWYWNLHMISQPSGTNPVTISPNFSRSHNRSIRVNPPPSRQEKRLLKKKTVKSRWMVQMMFLLTVCHTHRIHGTGIFTYMNGWFLW